MNQQYPVPAPLHWRWNVPPGGQPVPMRQHPLFQTQREEPEGPFIPPDIYSEDEIPRSPIPAPLHSRRWNVPPGGQTAPIRQHPLFQTQREEPEGPFIPPDIYSDDNISRSPIPAPLHSRWNVPPGGQPAPMRQHPLFQPQREEPEVPFIPPDIYSEDDIPRSPIPAPLHSRRWNVPPGGQPGPMRQHPVFKTQREEPQGPFIPPDIYYKDSDDIPRSSLPKQVMPLIPLRLYRFHPSKDKWKHITLRGASPSVRPPCTQLRIISWNIYMSSGQHEERLAEALRHLEADVLASKPGEPPPPCMILLQEVHAHVVPYLLSHLWVRRYFAVTPRTTTKWPREAPYGNLTLVSRTLDVHEAHILHFGVNSAMGRTALCVKVWMTYPGTQKRAVIAIVNTHLESLPTGGAARPKQLELCSKFLRLQGVKGGVVAGDMNAMGPGDAAIAKDFGLLDAWGEGAREGGETWGFQGQTEGKYPINRLDKIYYLPRMGYKVDKPRKVGVGIKIGHGRDALWVSDHYGLETTLRMKKRSQSS